jgi:hypothetical protein
MEILRELPTQKTQPRTNKQRANTKKTQRRPAPYKQSAKQALLK